MKIIGYTDLAARLATQSSQLYGTNLVNLMKLMCKEKDGQINIDFDDVVIRGLTVVKAGEITWPAPPIQVSAQPQAKPAAVKAEKKPEKPMSPWLKYGLMVLAFILFSWLANVAPPEVFIPLYRVRTLLCGRLLRGLECQSCAAYPADGGDQRNFGDYRCRRTAANRQRRLGDILLLHCGTDCQYQYFRRIHRHTAYA